jgi:hypothetical protein
LLQDAGELRERGGGGGERLDLLVCDLGQVPAEDSAEPSAVILERPPADSPPATSSRARTDDLSIWIAVLSCGAISCVRTHDQRC